MDVGPPKRFAHLHQHTAYSLLDGAARIKDLMAWVKEVTPGDAVVAMTDHGNLHGAVEFTKAAYAAQVKPIVGFEAYMTAGSRFERRRPEGKLDGGYYHLTLLAKDMTGYRNLCKLSSRAYLEGFYMKPRIDFELLEQHHEGIIALSGCLGAQLPRTILDVGPEAGEEVLQRYLRLFGDDYFLEFQDHGLEEQQRLNPVLRAFADRYGIAMVATNDGHYVRKEDARAHEALLAIQTKTVLSDEHRFRFPCDEFYVKTPEEMALAVPENAYPGALANTMVVADRCTLELPIGDRRVYQMPELPIPAGRTLAEQLRVSAYEGLGRRYPERITEAFWRGYLAAAGAASAASDAGLAAGSAAGVSADAAPLEKVWLRLARHAEAGRRAMREGEHYDRYETPHLDAFAAVAALIIPAAASAQSTLQSARSHNGVVAAAQPLATEASVRMLEMG
ncbi:MAG: PHP domain-containing protein, partial [Trueperaceae bacterium]|nr:PHP domain-containing protein [Trueperaceae bacterium]